MTAALTASLITPVTWDTGIPGPLRSGMKMEAGTNIRRRKLQDGGYEYRRFGSGAPDNWTLTWRLTASEHDDFITFWHDDLEMGSLWFTAAWITTIGYSSDYAGTFIGYPQEKVKRWNSGSSGYSDIQCNILIAAKANLYTISYTGSISVSSCGNTWGTL